MRGPISQSDTFGPTGGTPVMVWEGSIEASGQVLKKAESQHLMHCRLLAKPSTWPPHLEQGWAKLLVSRLLAPQSCRDATGAALPV